MHEVQAQNHTTFLLFFFGFHLLQGFASSPCLFFPCVILFAVCFLHREHVLFPEFHSCLGIITTVAPPQDLRCFPLVQILSVA